MTQKSANTFFFGQLLQCQKIPPFNNAFWLLIWIGPQKYHVRPMFYSYGGLKRKNVAVSFFLTPQFCKNKSWDLTRLWAAITPVPIWEKSICFCIVLVHYWPLPQKINGKSLKLAVWAVSVNFFLRFHIVCDRWQIMTDYAHFTFSDTIWPLLLSPNFGTQMNTLAETAS